MAGATFGANFSGPYSVLGAIDGFAAEIQTDAYVSAVLQYSHEKLSQYFDLWMDAWAMNDPDSFMHVYKWPSSWGGGDKPNYRNAMSNPDNRLWEHVYSGPAKSGVASFVFKNDDSFTPVNPILAAQGVKTGVHIFVHKATVMEYGLPVTIKPQLAKYLAYVINTAKGGGKDNAEQRFPNAAKNTMFSLGPVSIRESGNGHTKNKFTSAFKYWYGSMAANHMQNDILPRVEADLYREMNKTGAQVIGQVNKTKYVNMTGWASSSQAAYGKAKIEARQALKKLETNYRAEAARRRNERYGD